LGKKFVPLQHDIKDLERSLRIILARAAADVHLWFALAGVGILNRPPYFRKTVETLLRYVPPKYLMGLNSVVLTNRAGLTRNKRRQEVWSRNHKVRLAESLGSYSSTTKSSPAIVWLDVDDIVESGVPWFRWIPVLRYVVQGNVLYHEIGHHIHTEHRPIHEQREDVAEEWSGKLMRNFYRKHYWYIFPLLYAFARLTSPIFKRLQRTGRGRDDHR
jgi:hypothetical protein